MLPSHNKKTTLFQSGFKFLFLKFYSGSIVSNLAFIALNLSSSPN